MKTQAMFSNKMHYIYREARHKLSYKIHFEVFSSLRLSLFSAGEPFFRWMNHMPVKGAIIKI